MRAQKNNHRSPKMPKAITMIIALIGAPGLLGLPTPNEKSSRLAATTDAERDEKPLAQKARAARATSRLARTTLACRQLHTTRHFAALSHLDPQN